MSLDFFVFSIHEISFYILFYFCILMIDRLGWVARRLQCRSVIVEIDGAPNMVVVHERPLTPNGTILLIQDERV